MDTSISMSVDKNRAVFLLKQNEYLDAVFSLTADEDEARNRFMSLVAQTFDALFLAGEPPSGVFNISPNGKYDPFNTIGLFSQHQFFEAFLAQQLVPEEIAQRWQDWEKFYPKLKSQYPKLELLDMLVEVRKAHDMESSPDKYEMEVLEWVQSGEFTKMPECFRLWSVSAGLDEVFFDRLCVLHKKIGGWLVKEGYIGPFRFVAD